MLNFQIDGKNDKKALTFSFFMLEKSYLHQNGVELNFLFIGMASGHAISLRINPRIREDSKGVSAGERGDYLRYSKNMYQNTECHIKLEGKLSRKFKEWRGNRQGHVLADTHYKAYINPCLNAVNKSDLGFHIGPICVGATCCADDTYLLSDSPSGLQSSLNIASHYARRYRVIFNADKTKIVVTGSKHDMSFYQDTKPWFLNEERISVTENNEHLGLVVSGWNEEAKNVDQNIAQCRKSLFALLGPTYSYKCKISPVTQSHLWHTYNLPVLVSGLSALPIRPVHIL